MSDKATDSGERKSIGEKTQISLKTAVIITLIAVIPMTVFLMQMRADISDIKSMYGEQKEQLHDHETRIRDLEKKRP